LLLHDKESLMPKPLLVAAILLLISPPAPTPAFEQAQASDTPAQAAPAPPPVRQITLFDRQGRITGTVGQPGVYTQPVFSPDGTRLAVISSGNVWVYELTKGTALQLTNTPEPESAPVWSRDGSQVGYSRLRGVFRRAANGTGFEETVGVMPGTLNDWSRDGSFILGFAGGPTAATKGDVFLMALSGNVRLVVLIGTPADEIGPRFSYDGNLIAYRSDESGRTELYVRPFNGTATIPSVGEPTRVSSNGGLMVRWRNDGRELYYLSNDGAMMATPITSLNPFKAGAPAKLFQAPTTLTLIPRPGGVVDVSGDGERFALLLAPK
jgi:Tol biopolymer transport system component